MRDVNKVWDENKDREVCFWLYNRMSRGFVTKNFSPLYFDIEQQRYILYKYARKEFFPIHDLDNMRA